MKCHRRLHQLTPVRFESIMLVWSATHLFSSPVPLRLPSETNRPVLSEIEVRTRLAERFRDAFLRARRPVPNWISDQILNPGQLDADIYVCSVNDCNREYDSRELALACETKHRAVATEQAARPDFTQFNTKKDITDHESAHETIRQCVERWGVKEKANVEYELKMKHNYVFKKSQLLMDYTGGHYNKEWNEMYKVGTKMIN